MNQNRAIFFGAVLAITFTIAFGQPPAKEEEQKINGLIDALVFEDQKDANASQLSPEDEEKADEENAKQYEKCQQACKQLSILKDKAFPFLVKHLDDKRPSIPFRNHYAGDSVGNACFWNIYFQLQDRPNDYSSYGESRKGRDGKDHTKPYWEGTPFGDAGSLPKWLKKHEKLTYPEMQIECLQWLLNKEREIGASDSESYFENILPLEIRILERKLETGSNVREELDRLRLVMKKKSAADVPVDLLPNKAEQGADGKMPKASQPPH